MAERYSEGDERGDVDPIKCAISGSTGCVNGGPDMTANVNTRMMVGISSIPKTGLPMTFSATIPPGVNSDCPKSHSRKATFR